jgi:hypothetical protein
MRIGRRAFAPERVEPERSDWIAKCRHTKTRPTTAIHVFLKRIIPACLAVAGAKADSSPAEEPSFQFTATTGTLPDGACRFRAVWEDGILSRQTSIAVSNRRPG